MSIPEKYMCVIGAAAMDLMGYSDDPLVYQDSNPGCFVMHVGGVGRNIAENLARLDINTELITAVGDDYYGQQIVDHCKVHKVGVGHSLKLKGGQTAIHMAIGDEQNDLALGIAAMDICDEINVHYLEKHLDILSQAEWIVLETNISEGVLMWIVTSLPHKNYFVDTVSGPKSKRILGILPHITVLKLNSIEASALSGISITDDRHLSTAANWFREKGVKSVIISLGERGVFYLSSSEQYLIPPKAVNVMNTVGAGDAFSAGYLYGCGITDHEPMRIKYGMACAQLALQSEHAVSDNLQMDLLQSIANNYE